MAPAPDAYAPRGQEGASVDGEAAEGWVSRSSDEAIHVSAAAAWIASLRSQ